MTATTDLALLAAVLRGDADAWRQLLARHGTLVYRCAARVMVRGGRRDRADFDEVYAEVLFQLVAGDMRKLRSFDPRRGLKLSSWLGMIASNAAYDFLRRAARRPPTANGHDDTVEQIAGDATSPLAMLIEKERRRELIAMLDQLTARDRRFVELYYQHDFDADAVASAMQISRKTVYTKKHKIRAQLTRALGDRSELDDLAAA